MCGIRAEKKCIIYKFNSVLMRLLEAGLQPQSGEIPLLSNRTISLVSPQSCGSVDAGAWCKRTLRPV